MQRLWLIFSQAATVAVAVLFVISTFHPEWLPSRVEPRAPIALLQHRDLRALHGARRQPLGMEGRDHEQHRDGDGRGLGKDQPESLHCSFSLP